MYICKNRVGVYNFQAANPRQTIIKPSRPVSATNRSIRVNTTGCKSLRRDDEGTTQAAQTLAQTLFRWRAIWERVGG